MQWEYACLVRKVFVVNKSSRPKDESDSQGWTWAWEWGHAYYFYSAAGTATFKGDSSVEILNQLGQEGWEALAVEPRYAYFRESYGKYGPGPHPPNQKDVDADSETLVERTIWLKRPVNTAASR
jgi:hypothetical protein